MTPKFGVDITGLTSNALVKSRVVYRSKVGSRTLTISWSSKNPARRPLLIACSRSSSELYLAIYLWLRESIGS